MSPGSPSTARAAWREALLVVAAFSCLTAIATFPLALHLGRALPGDLGDPLLTSWVLGWDADRLRHGLRGFRDAPIVRQTGRTRRWFWSVHELAVFVR